MTKRLFAASLLMTLLPLFGASEAGAADTRTTVRPGVELLHRVTTNPAQDIFAVRVDLSLPQVGLHASADRRGEEWAVTTPTFARNTGSLIAINGDFSDITSSGAARLRPLGLGISDGLKWNDHIHDNTIGGAWGYFGCTVDKHCQANVERPLDQAFWFSDPTKRPYRFFQAMGANGVPLVNGGRAHAGCFDTIRNPRSAIGVEADGVHLWMVVIDGRDDGRASGMTCDETRQLLLNLGVADGVMLDGGGSSTLVVDGAVKNQPSDGAPRTVGNHLGVTYQDAIDSRCERPNARFCNGNIIATCQGGRFLGEGDCAAFGTTCQEDGNFAFCVLPNCPDGDGLGAVCSDPTHIFSCNDGVPGTGDCGAFGLACGSDDAGASCMDRRCEAGPHSSFCTAAGALATCTDGVYGEAPCPGATTCTEAGGARCVAPGAPDVDAGTAPPPDEQVDAGADDAPSDDAGVAEVDGPSGTNEPTDGDGPALPPSVGQGCNSAPPSLGALVAAVALLMRRRRR